MVSTGDRSLASVAAAINGANAGANAAAIKVADGAWILQLSSSKSGTDNAMALDATVFAGVGGLLQTSGAQDAKITIGSGPGAYSVEASGNTFTDVLTGVTLTATTESATPVTVSVGRNDGATADGVGQLIAAANSLLADIKLQSSYNAATKTASPLTTDASVRRLAEEVRATITAIVGTGDTRLASTIGITTDARRPARVRPGEVHHRPRAPIPVASNASSVVAARRPVPQPSRPRPMSRSPAPTAVVVTTAAKRATTGEILVGGSALRPGDRRSRRLRHGHVRRLRLARPPPTSSPA